MEGSEAEGSAPGAPPSPLSGGYLLIVLGEPYSALHKGQILRKIQTGFLSWDKEACHVDLEKELQLIATQAPEGEESKNGERLIQFASENLVTEVLIHPTLNTLTQCIRNLLSSFTRHRHIIHAGYTFTGNGSWIIQDGTFSLADLIDAFQEPDVLRVLRAYENTVSVDIHCAPEGDWSTARMRRESFSKLCCVRVNPDDSLTPATNVDAFMNYIAKYLQEASLEQLLEPSDVVGNIRFSHPTLYVFPGGQGDAALFGINGFNMLVDGGFSRKACFWDFTRHLDRLDAVLITRLNNSNCNGIAAVLQRKRQAHVYPQIGHFFCNIQERRQPQSPDGEKERDSLLINLAEEGQDMVFNLRHLHLKPHFCSRDTQVEPINLYHKVGHGKLDMYVLSPAKDSRDLKEFLSKWHTNDQNLFGSSMKKKGEFHFPLNNLVSICALLVWQPANPNETITRLLFPGSAPQHKIFEGLDKLKHLEFLKHPVCSAKTLSPSSSTLGMTVRSTSKTRPIPAVIDKLLPGEGLNKPVSKTISSVESINKQNVAKSATIPVAAPITSDTKSKTVSAQKPAIQKQPKSEKPVDGSTVTKTDIETDKDKNKIDKDKVDKDKLDKDKELNKEKESETEPKETEGKGIPSKLEKPPKALIEGKSKAEQKAKSTKVKTETKQVAKNAERKPSKTPSIEKKGDSVKSSPTTPKKTIDSKSQKAASTRAPSKTRASPSATPAKSAKEENNRKVVESKRTTSLAGRTVPSKPPKKEVQKTEKRVIKRPPTASPSKAPEKSESPKKPISKVSKLKSKKEAKKEKPETEKAVVTDSSTVSTPSTADAEITSAKLKEVEKEKESIPQGELAEKETKSDQAEQENIDDAEKLSDRLEDEGIEKDVELTDKGDISDDGSKVVAKDEFVTEKSYDADETGEEKFTKETAEEVKEDDSLRIRIQEKDESERDEEDEILIIEKVEIEPYIDDSTQDQESIESHEVEEIEDELQKHLRDETESEKKQNKELDKSDQDSMRNDDDTVILEKAVDIGDAKVIDEEVKEETKIVCDTEKVDTPKKSELKSLDLKEQTTSEIVLSPENKEQIEGEVQEIITSATEFVAKTKLDAKDASELSAEGMISDDLKSSGETKDLQDIQSSDEKNVVQKYDQIKDVCDDLNKSKETADLKYTAEESQPDEKLSTTIESGATTAPTLPEDERIPLDEIKEGIEEKHVKEETKEKDIVGVTKIEQPTSLPQVAVGSGKTFDGRIQVTRDIVKTPDEVADLPVHEEVDAELYESEELTGRDFHRSKDDLLGVTVNKKNATESKDSKVSLEKESDINEDDKAQDKKIAQEPEVPEKQKTDKEVVKSNEILQKDSDTVPSQFTEKASEDIDAKSIQKIAESSKTGIDDLHQKMDFYPESRVVEEPVHTTIKAPEIAEYVMLTPDSTPDSPIPKDEVKVLDKEVTETNIDEKDIDTKLLESEVKLSDETKDVSDVTDKEKHISEDAGKEIVSQVETAKIEDVAMETEKESQFLKSAIPKPGEKEKEVDESKSNETPKLSSDIAVRDVIESKTEQHESLSKDDKKDDTPKDLSTKTDVCFTDHPKELQGSKDTITTPLTKEKEEVQSDQDTEKKSPKSDSQLLASEDLEYSAKVVSSELSTQDKDQKPDLGDSKTSTPEPKPIPKEVTDVSETKPSVVDTKLNETSSADETKECKVLLDKPTISVSDKDHLTKESKPVSSLTENKKVKSVDNEKEFVELDEKVEKLDSSVTTPKSISPVPSEKEKISSDSKKDQLDSTPPTPKSVSPSPSEPGQIEVKDTEKDEKLEPVVLTPKSISPVPPEKEKYAADLMDKLDLGTPKSTSPLPVDEDQAKEVDIDSTKEVTEGKITPATATPKSVSPVPSDKETDVIEKKEKSDLTPKSVSPTPSEQKSVSPTPSEQLQIDKTHITSDKNGEILDSIIIPKSTSPTLSEKEKYTFDEKEKMDPALKSVSPLPPEKEQVDKNEITGSDTTAKEEKVSPATVTGKSASPVTSDKEKYEIDDSKETLKSTSPSPKSVSPLPPEVAGIDKDLGLGSNKKDEDKFTLTTETQKSVSPEPPVKEKYPINDKEKSDSSISTPKSASPLPSEKEKGKEEGIKPDKKVDEKVPQSTVTSESVSSIPAEKEKYLSDDVKEKLDSTTATPKSISPIPAEKEKRLSDAVTEKLDSTTVTPKSASPVPSEKEKLLSDDVTEKLDSTTVIPKSVSPVPAEKEKYLGDDVKEKLDSATVTPKSVSPVPSEKEKYLSDDIKEKLDSKTGSPKSVSPVPSEKEKYLSENITEKLDSKTGSPKSVSPVPSEKEKYLSENITEKLDSNTGSPKSVSPVPSEKEKYLSEIVTEKLESKTGSPKSVSPVPSEKEKYLTENVTEKLDSKTGSPKSVSPVPSEKEKYLSDDIKEKLDSKTGSPKSVSPVPSEKEKYLSDDVTEKLDSKTGSPKSVSPSPSEKSQIDKGISIEPDKNKDLKLESPKSVSPVPFGKEECVTDEKKKMSDSTSEISKTILSSSVEKPDIERVKAEDGEELDSSTITTKSILPGQSEKETENKMEKLDSSFELDIERKEASTPKSVSPTPSEKEAKLLHKTEKLDLTPPTSKSVSPSLLVEDQVTTAITELGDTITNDKLESTVTASVSPTPSEKVPVGGSKEQLDSSITPKSVSPTPSEIAQMDTKYISDKLSKDGKEKSDSPSVTPEPSQKDKIQTDDKSEKSGSPKPISPTPSEKVSVGAKEVSIESDKNLKDEVKPSVSSKPVSPEPKLTEKEQNFTDQSEKEEDSTTTTAKSFSPLPSEVPQTWVKEIETVEKEQGSESAAITPKSVSPELSEKDKIASNLLKDTKISEVFEESTTVTKEEHLESNEKENDKQLKSTVLSPKSVSPVPTENHFIDSKDTESENVELKEKLEFATTKTTSDSPLPEIKKNEGIDEKEQVKLELKSVTPTTHLSSEDDEKSTDLKSIICSEAPSSTEPTKEEFKPVGAKSLSPTLQSEIESINELIDTLETTNMEQLSSKDISQISLEKQSEVKTTSETESLKSDSLKSDIVIRDKEVDDKSIQSRTDSLPNTSKQSQDKTLESELATLETEKMIESQNTSLETASSLTTIVTESGTLGLAKTSAIESFEPDSKLELAGKVSPDLTFKQEKEKSDLLGSASPKSVTPTPLEPKSVILSDEPKTVLPETASTVPYGTKLGDLENEIEIKSKLLIGIKNDKEPMKDSNLLSSESVSETSTQSIAQDKTDKKTEMETEMADSKTVISSTSIVGISSGKERIESLPLVYSETDSKIDNKGSIKLEKDADLIFSKSDKSTEESEIFESDKNQSVPEKEPKLGPKSSILLSNETEQKECDQKDKKTVTTVTSVSLAREKSSEITKEVTSDESIKSFSDTKPLDEVKKETKEHDIKDLGEKKITDTTFKTEDNLELKDSSVLLMKSLSSSKESDITQDKDLSVVPSPVPSVLPEHVQTSESRTKLFDDEMKDKVGSETDSKTQISKSPSPCPSDIDVDIKKEPNLLQSEDYTTITSGESIRADNNMEKNSVHESLETTVKDSIISTATEESKLDSQTLISEIKPLNEKEIIKVESEIKSKIETSEVSVVKSKGDSTLVDLNKTPVSSEDAKKEKLVESSTTSLDKAEVLKSLSSKEIDSELIKCDSSVPSDEKSVDLSKTTIKSETDSSKSISPLPSDKAIDKVESKSETDTSKSSSPIPADKDKASSELKALDLKVELDVTKPSKEVTEIDTKVTNGVSSAAELRSEEFLTGVPTKLDEKSEFHSVQQKISGSNLTSQSLDDSLSSSASKSSSTKDESGTVRRMVVTASSEDGGNETELCASGTINYKPSELQSVKTGSDISEGAITKTAILSSHDEKAAVDSLLSSSDSSSTVTKTTTTSVKTHADGSVTTITTTTHTETVPTLDSLENAKVTEKSLKLDDTGKDSDISLVKGAVETASHAVKSLTGDVSLGDTPVHGVISELKKDALDSGRSGTPASDMSERELDIGGPSTPHSEISSGQVSRAATNVWGENSEGRPDSRHYDSDDDIPCSPLSVTSHVAISPPQFDFEMQSSEHDDPYFELSKQKDSKIPAAMTSSFYGSLPEDDPSLVHESQILSSESAMYSSVYIPHGYETETDEPEKYSESDDKLRHFETMFSSASKENIDFETARKEHCKTRGEDLTKADTIFTNGKKESVEVNGRAIVNGKSSSISSVLTVTEDKEKGKSIVSEAASSKEPSTVKTKVESTSISSQKPGGQSSSAQEFPDKSVDPIQSWGKPLGLPPPPLEKNCWFPTWDPIEEWGKPLGLPTPAPPLVKKDSTEDNEVDLTPNSNKTTPKKVAKKNIENNKSASYTPGGKEVNTKSKRPESPIKRTSNKENRKTQTYIYLDLSYVPHNGNSHYTNVEFFKRVRARYYVFSGTEPSRDVFNALLEAKQTWEDKDLEVTIIPTYDTDILGYWVAENEELLAKYKIDLSPSASRCTINLQDHETSCSAYRLEF